MTVGYFANSFDLFNVRDVDLINQAQRECSELVLGVFSDDFATRILGRRPVVPLSERVLLVSHVRGVSKAVVHDDVWRPSSEAMIFSVAGDVPLPYLIESWMLTPRRETASKPLREALGRMPVEDVA